MKVVRSQSGTSFIEVVTAVGLFAMVAIGLSPALLSARKVADLGKDQSIATALAQDKIEQIRQAASVSNGSDGPLQPNGSANGIFSRNWTVYANSPTTGVNRVEVKVSWRERTSTSDQAITLVTLVPQ
jgi:Tfp pilus assembly protein PilV